VRGLALAALPRLDRLPLELVDQRVDRRLERLRGGVRAQGQAAREDCRLGGVIVLDLRVGFDVQLELDVQVFELALELAELLLRVVADRGADLEVPALHLELHRLSFDAGLGP